MTGTWFDQDVSQIAFVSRAEFGQFVAVLLPVFNAILVPADFAELVELANHHQRGNSRRDAFRAIMVNIARIGPSMLHEAETTLGKLTGTMPRLRPASRVSHKHQRCGREFLITGNLCKAIKHVLNVGRAESAFQKDDGQFLFGTCLTNARVLSKLAFHQSHPAHHNAAHLLGLRRNPQIRHSFAFTSFHLHGVLKHGG